METEEVNKKKGFGALIAIASIAIPLVVALLYLTPRVDFGFDITFLPLLNAIINGTTFITLIFAFVAIKRRDIELHKTLMKSAIIMSLLFLVSYIMYHLGSEPTEYCNDGTIRSIYFFILVSHIVLAGVIVPLVLISYVRAINEKFDKHKKIAKITLPIWLYVTLTGVIVYVMISPCYV